ncbi:MAG: hypothetical protein QXJ75_05510, partial [Candidatus Bathyarchaeia archaeon]
MHPINKLLSIFGLRLERTRIRIPKEFEANYRRQMEEVERNSRGFRVFKKIIYEAGFHPQSYIDFECEFASSWIARLKPNTILDIGSYRHWIIGLLANFHVTTVDIRDRKAFSMNENVIVCDA